jgi:hypothetical protein
MNQGVDPAKYRDIQYDDLGIKDLVAMAEESDISIGVDARGSLGDQGPRVRGETESDQTYVGSEEVSLYDSQIDRACDELGIDQI